MKTRALHDRRKNPSDKDHVSPKSEEKSYKMEKKKIKEKEVIEDDDDVDNIYDEDSDSTVGSSDEEETEEETNKLLKRGNERNPKCTNKANPTTGERSARPNSKAIWIVIPALSLIVLAFSWALMGANGDQSCTFNGGRSYWDVVSAIQNDEELGISELLTKRMREVEKDNPTAIRTLKESLSRKKDDCPLVLLLAGPPEAREDMFTTSEWLASSLLAQPNNSVMQKGKMVRPSYMVGEEYHGLVNYNSPGERRTSFHSALSQSLQKCGKNLLAVDASLVVEFLDLLSTVVEDGANPHLQIYVDKSKKKEGGNINPRELSTREAVILFIASLSTQELNAITQMATEKDASSTEDLILRKVKENFKWEDRFGQRIAQVILFK